MKEIIYIIKKIGLLVLVSMITIFIVSCQGNKEKELNQDNSFSMVTNWTPSGLINHYNSNTYCEAFNYFVVEGLYKYVRSTDEIYMQLAEELPDHGKVTLDLYKKQIGEDAYNYFVSQGVIDIPISKVKIKDNAAWQNGENFTAKDVWAYYYMIHPTSSNYMAAVVPVDDKTVVFVWNPVKEPADKVKNLLIAQDKNGTVKYDEFSSYIDPIHKLVMESPVNENPNLWGAFNRFSTKGQIVELNKIRNSFFSYNPSWYIATGPFKIKTFSATQILLEKNEFYWNKDKIGFEKIKLYSSNDLNQIYQLITNNHVDYYDGFIQKDTLDSMLNTNKNLINLKMYDPGSIGITFNISKKIFKSVEVRRAFQYIFNREEITMAANPYGTVSYYPLLGMAETEAKTYMSKEAFNNLPKYSYDQNKASELLIAQGWVKNGGKWYSEGEEVVINLAAPSTDDKASTAVEAAAAQLTDFGIKVNTIKTNAFYATVLSDGESPYDMCLEWTDLNMSFSYPTGSYNQFANVYAKYCRIPRYPENHIDHKKANNVILEFDGLGTDTKKYEFADYINSFYSVSPEELTYLIDVFNTGLANMSLGIQFFQNVTASTINVGKIKNVPLEKYWKENRNVSYVPEAGTEDFFNVAKTNFPFAAAYMITYGIYQPNK